MYVGEKKKWNKEGIVYRPNIQINTANNSTTKPSWKQ